MDLKRNALNVGHHGAFEGFEVSLQCISLRHADAVGRSL